MIRKLIGIGVGPFNLSLLALLPQSVRSNSLFIDCKDHFSWHPELMFGDATMQTTYLKDLVTPVDPTNPMSFLNYLVQKGLFYQFLNTDRKSIQRYEFEDYCRWVAANFDRNIQWQTSVESVEWQTDRFAVRTKGEDIFYTDSICIGSGPTKYVPDFAEYLLGEHVFHAKSPQTQSMNWTGQRVLVVGGGQTGLEIFANGLKDRWGHAHSVQLVSDRTSLSPLDEAPFSNEYFTPQYVNDFYSISEHRKADIVEKQLLTSDGNTPQYLKQFYHDLYIDKHYQKKYCDYRISPMRRVVGLFNQNNSYQVQLQNLFNEQFEELEVDMVVFATGFKNQVPQYLAPLSDAILWGKGESLQLNEDYSVKTQLPASNKIFAMNFARKTHGIADPQTSLMAWRSATIINSLMQEPVYSLKSQPNFIDYNSTPQKDL